MLCTIIYEFNFNLIDNNKRIMQESSEHGMPSGSFLVFSSSQGVKENSREDGYWLWRFSIINCQLQHLADEQSVIMMDGRHFSG